MIFALIGAGKWGQNYLSAAKKMPNVGIKYVCSGTDSLSSLPSEYIKVDNYKDLAKKEDIDGVIIAVPSKKHFELVSFFLSINKPVLVEKPMVISLSEAKKLKNIIGSKKIKFMVGNIFLYNEAFQEFVRNFKKVKDILYLNFEDCNQGPVRDDVSALWDWGPHDISMCLELLGKPFAVSAWAVNSLRPETKLYDMVYARLSYRNNINAYLRVGWLSPFKKREVLAVGKYESLFFNDTVKEKIISINGVKQSHLSYNPSEPLINELKEFVEVIKKNIESRSNFKNNFLIIQIIDAIERSIERSGISIIV